MPKDGDIIAKSSDDKKVDSTASTSNSNEPETSPSVSTEKISTKNNTNDIPQDKIKEPVVEMNVNTQPLAEVKEPNFDSLEQIRRAQDQLAAIKRAIKNLIEAMGTNPSYIERASKYWSTSSTPKKILSGATITASPTLLGFGVSTIIAAPTIPILAAVVGTSTFFLSTGYIFSGMALNNHSQNHEEFVTKIQNGILSLADILTLIIEKLGNITHDLTIQMDAFEQQNLRLTTHVNTLVEQLTDLTTQITIFKETEAYLKSVTISLEEQTLLLKTTGEKNEELLEKQEIELQKTRNEHEKVAKLLEEKILEVDIVKKSLNLELEKTKKTASHYKSAVTTLTTTCKQNEQDRVFFKDKLDAILEKAEGDFSAFQQNLKETETQFSTALEKLNKGNEKQEELLRKEALALETLENMLKPKVTPPQENKNAPKGRWLGFYRRKPTEQAANSVPEPKMSVSSFGQ